MGPDRSNYEIWLIDYLDGTLDSERTGLLLAFLDENPDLKEEFADISSSSVIPPDSHFKNRNDLRKSASEMSQHQFELLCVASSENDLEDNQRAELEEIISSDLEKHKTLQLYRKIRLSAPPLKYNYKYKLRKLTAGQKIFRTSLALVSSAAAILAIIMLLRKPEAIIPATESVSVNSVVSPASDATPVNKQAIEKATSQSGKLNARSTALNTFSEVQSRKTAVKNNGVEKPALSDSVLPEIKRYDIDKVAFPDNGFKKPDTDIRLASVNIPAANEEPDQQGNGPGQYFEKLLREKVINSKEPQKASISAYDIADAGVTGLKKLFGWNMSLKKNRDAKGDIKSISFNSKLVSFNAPLKKSTHLP